MQSSTHGKKVAALAVDGDIDTASCTTMESENPWWAVDLGWGVSVNQVKITNDQYLNYGELIVMSKSVSPLCLWLIYTELSQVLFSVLVLHYRAMLRRVRCDSMSSVRVS